MVDNASKFLLAFPAPNKQAETIAKGIIENFADIPSLLNLTTTFDN
ncbi:MAG: hypothetical protein P1P63_08165 [Treponemataceae bacterium]